MVLTQPQTTVQRKLMDRCNGKGVEHSSSAAVSGSYLCWTEVGRMVLTQPQTMIQRKLMDRCNGKILQHGSAGKMPGSDLGWTEVGGIVLLIVLRG